MKRRIKRADIRFISLCPRGANNMPVIYKSDGTVQFDTLIKATEDAGEITCVVYAPEQRDTQGDIASAPVIKQMQRDFSKNKGTIDIIHDGKPVSPDRAFLAENFLVQKGDDRFKDWKDNDGKPVDVTHGWAVVIKVDDPKLRAEYKEGKWNGVSMGGTGELEVEKTSDDSLVEKLLKGLGNLFAGKTGTTSPGDDDMNEAELQKHLGEFKTTLITDLTKIVGTAVGAAISAQADAGLAAAAGVVDGDSDDVRKAKITLHKDKLAKGQTSGAPASPAAVKKSEPPKFTGDPTDAAAVAKFEYDAAVWKIKDSMDPTDPAQVRKAADEIAKLQKPVNPADQTALEKAAGIVDGDSEEVRKLKIDLVKAQQRSNQGTTSGGGAPLTGGNATAQAEIDLGNAIAKAANANNGNSDPATPAKK